MTGHPTLNKIPLSNVMKDGFVPGVPVSTVPNLFRYSVNLPSPDSLQPISSNPNIIPVSTLLNRQYQQGGHHLTPSIRRQMNPFRNTAQFLPKFQFENHQAPVQIPQAPIISEYKLSDNI